MSGVKIVYQDVAPGAKAASSASMSDLQGFCDLRDLRSDQLTVPQVATLEDDYWKLGATFKLFPDAPAGLTWGAWSQSMADADGLFSVPPVLTLTFSANFSSVGLTLRFDPYGPTWCSDLHVEWYQDATLLAEADFTPDGPQFFCAREVHNYNKLELTFRAMSTPWRYLKLRDPVYGMVRDFDSGELRDVNLFQAASPISEDLQINTLDFTLSSRDPVPYMFQRKQPLSVYHNDTLQGVFYISASKRAGAQLYDISATDQTGLLDEQTHRGGIYSGVTFAALAAEIMGAQPYEIDSTLQEVLLSGWLPIGTARENMAQAAFAVGAVADTSGRDRLRVFPAAAVATAAFGSGRVYEGAEVETASLVTAVEVTEHAYALGTETRELWTGTLTGSAIVTFGEPMHSLTITGGTITESGANYAVIAGTGGAVTLTGKVYVHTTRIVRVDNPDIGANDIVNVVRVSDATLVTAANSAAVAQQVYDHYLRRETVVADLVLAGELPGDRVTVDTAFGGVRAGHIASLDTNLARKRIGRAEILLEEATT